MDSNSRSRSSEGAPEPDAVEDLEGERRRVCIDCGVLSPATETNYTLISQRHGWRLTLGADADGKKLAHWRCPDCWGKHRRKAAR